MFLIRGVLLAGQFCTRQQLDKMTHEDQRNTLIFEMGRHGEQPNLQSFNDDTLAGMGAVLVFLRTARIRDDAALKGMTADDMRNILIVELGAQTHMSGPALQGMSNIEAGAAGPGQAAARRAYDGQLHPRRVAGGPVPHAARARQDVARRPAQHANRGDGRAQQPDQLSGIQRFRARRRGRGDGVSAPSTHPDGCRTQEDERRRSAQRRDRRNRLADQPGFEAAGPEQHGPGAHSFRRGPRVQDDIAPYRPTVRGRYGAQNVALA